MIRHDGVLVCSTCEEELPVQAYYLRDGKPQKQCKACVIKRVRERQDRHKAVSAIVVASIRKEASCARCGSTGKIEFHNPEHKGRDYQRISSMVSRGRPLTSILAEINRCEPLCLSCHHKADRFDRGVCQHGHDVTDERNIYVNKDGRRRCRICRNRRDREAQRRKRAKTP